MKFRKLGRAPVQRRSMLRRLATALVKHERIMTTLARAKEMRRVADRVSRTRAQHDHHRPVSNTLNRGSRGRPALPVSVLPHERSDGSVYLHRMPRLQLVHCWLWSPDRRSPAAVCVCVCSPAHPIIPLPCMSPPTGGVWSHLPLPRPRADSDNSQT